jgi:Tfp pilus assembly protein PilO
MTKASLIMVGVIALLLSFVFVYKPLSDLWNELDRRVEVVNLQYLRNTKTVSNFNDYIALFQKYEEVSRQEKSDEEEGTLFLKEIEAFGLGLNLAINDIKPMPTVKDSHTTSFLIRLEMEGTIEDFIAYLHAIASSNTLIRVEDLSLQTVSRRNNVLNAKVTLSKTFLA